MKKNLKNSYEDIDKFFAAPPTTNQKAWSLINTFYHLVLSYMEENGITQAELARKLGKSRSAISQMFKKTPNLTVKKMVEIADAIGIDLLITSPQVELINKTADSARDKAGTSLRLKHAN